MSSCHSLFFSGFGSFGYKTTHSGAATLYRLLAIHARALRTLWVNASYQEFSTFAKPRTHETSNLAGDIGMTDRVIFERNNANDSQSHYTPRLSSPLGLLRRHLWWFGVCVVTYRILLAQYTKQASNILRVTDRLTD